MFDSTSVSFSGNGPKLRYARRSSNNRPKQQQPKVRSSGESDSATKTPRRLSFDWKLNPPKTANEFADIYDNTLENKIAEHERGTIHGDRYVKSQEELGEYGIQKRIKGRE